MLAFLSYFRHVFTFFNVFFIFGGTFFHLCLKLRKVPLQRFRDRQRISNQ